MQDINEDKQAASQAYSQTENIDKGNELVFLKIPYRNLEIVVDHGYTLLGSMFEV